MVLFTSFNESRPGVFVQEGVSGGNVGSISPFNKVILVGYGDPTATKTPQAVSTAAEARQALQGSNGAFIPSDATLAAIDAYFANLNRTLHVLPVEDADDLDAVGPTLNGNPDAELAIWTCPDVEAEVLPGIPLEVVLALAEANFGILFVSVPDGGSKPAVSNSPNGHLMFFTGKVLTDSSSRVVAASTLAAAAAMRRIVTEGIRQPGAGPKAFVRGVTGGRHTNAELETLTDDSVNAITIRNVGGLQVFGYITAATESAFSAGTARQIFNVLGASLRDVAQQFLFESIDGQDVLFGTVRRRFSDVCQQLYREGSLFGDTPADAYRVVCDQTNNVAFTLENRELRVDVFAAPSPFAEQVLVGVFRANIGEVPQV